MRCRLMVLSSCADPLKSITILWLRRWHGPLRCEHQIIKILIYSLHSEVVLSRTPSKTPKMRHIFALIVVVYASSTAFGQNSRPRPSTIYQIMGPPRRSVGYPFKANDIRVHLPLRSKLTCMVSPLLLQTQLQMLDFSGSKLRIWPSASWRSIPLREDDEKEIGRRGWRPDGGSSHGVNPICPTTCLLIPIFRR